MTTGQGFDLHPLAAQDITDIWTYIADEVRKRPAVFERKSLPSFAPWCQSRPQTPGPDFASSAFYRGARIPDCLRAGGKASVGCRGDARTAQSPRDGRYPARQGITPSPRHVTQRAFCDRLPGTVADAPGGITSEYPTIRPERGGRFPQRRPRR